MPALRGAPGRLVRLHFSAWSRGLAVTVNVNPESPRSDDTGPVGSGTEREKCGLDIRAMAGELREVLRSLRAGDTEAQGELARLPEELRVLRQIALAGDAEPTLSASFDEVVTHVVYERAVSRLPFFKIVLFTDATALDLPAAQAGLRRFSPRDEVWMKFGGGWKAIAAPTGKSVGDTGRAFRNIVTVARERPVVVQSVFVRGEGGGTSEAELAVYLDELRKLLAAGAKISEAQICSAPELAPAHPCAQVPLATLMQIAARVREATRLPTGVF
jgi:hypothetical protein